MFQVLKETKRASERGENQLKRIKVSVLKGTIFKEIDLVVFVRLSMDNNCLRSRFR